MTTHNEDLVSLNELRSVLSAYAGPDNPRARPSRHGLRDLRWTHRRLLAVVVAAVALALPALAFSGVLGHLFAFSNHGTPIPRMSLRTVHGLEAISARPGSFVQLASRDGIAVYAAHRKTQNKLCFFYGEAGRPSDLGGSCLAPGTFPSPSLPVWDMSGVSSGPPFSVQYLVGVAADGVRSIQVLARDCHPVATVPVINNVYIDVLKPMAPKVGLIIGEPYIVARDASGKVVWHKPVFAVSSLLPRCDLG